MSDVTADDVTKLLERAEQAEAREIRAIRALRSLVARVRRVGGYSEPSEQHALREAEALLVEVQR